MATRKLDTLNLNFNKSIAKGTFLLHIFEDHGHFVGYMPSLNLTAYGDSPNEAGERLLKEVCDDYFRNLMALGRDGAERELAKLGWKKRPLFGKQFTSDCYVDKEGVLKNFNLPEETKVDTKVVTV